MSPLVTVEVAAEADVVRARQRARDITRALGFAVVEQTRVATAVSEVARNALQYAGGGRIAFILDESAGELVIEAVDHGPGLPRPWPQMVGRPSQSGGMGVGLVGSSKLVDRFAVDSEPGQGTRITLGKRVPPAAKPRITADAVSEELAREPPTGPLEVLREQNQLLLGALRDLEDRQREQAESHRGVAALVTELEDRSIAMGEAAARRQRSVAHLGHEVRTPIHAISSLAELLLGADTPLPEQQRKPLELIRSSAAQLLELVNDLLDSSSLEAGKLPVHARQFTAEGLFGTLRGIFRALHSNSDVELVFDDPGSVPELHTDEGKLAQILRNLIANALKYTARGHVRVSARAAGNAHVCFEVADTGFGIAPEHREAVFDPWRRIENTTQRGVRGAGTGTSPLA